jgi:release factor glutamine methyltransferase
VTLYDRLAAGRAHLVAAGLPPADAAIDVDVMARAILGWDRARVLGDGTEPVPPSLEPRFSEWIERRAAREPVAYIVGAREFWGLEFRVTPDVLIPRPETELVVEAALERLDRAGAAAPRVADVGTGSGCLAVSLAVERPSCVVIATDVSGVALVVALDNARRHGVESRVTFTETSFLDGIDGPFDLIAANPPYVKDGDGPALARDVQHEPAVALFGGVSGLGAVASTLDAAGRTLAGGGWLVMEFGFGQEDDVRRLVAERPALRLDHVRADLQQIPRVAIVERVGD